MMSSLVHCVAAEVSGAMTPMWSVLLEAVPTIRGLKSWCTRSLVDQPRTLLERDTVDAGSFGLISYLLPGAPVGS